ncbi:MAG: PilW family protein [Desulfuromonadales bacterium]
MLNLTGKQWCCAKQRGFSLVEMIIVMAMLGVVMMAVMSLFIPAVRSTSVQTQVSDVQANLRLAMNRMTQDLVLAGFLVNPGYDTGGTAGPIYWEGGDPTTDLTIRTRSVGNSFARIIANNNTGKIGLSDVEMLSSFPVNTKVRIFAPMNAVEAEGVGAVYDEDAPSDYDKYIYTIILNNPVAETIDGVSCPASLTVTPFTFPTGVLKEAIILKAGQRPMQTIRYRVNNGTLERIVNGTTQFLARNVESVLFAYQNSVTGAVKRVDITLTGQPAGLPGGGIESSAKDRQLQTSVALRNVY